MSKRVLLVDDHNIMHERLKALLGRTTPNIVVVAEAATSKEALQQAAQFCPDVIVMDLNMQEMYGIEATRNIMTGDPDIKVIALSMFLDRRPPVPPPSSPSRQVTAEPGERVRIAA
jgi:DNA-binding NarL/FixJ family response regulator